ncbi:hypothetical protein BJ878DRAFT_501517 [Calycina marina]|uniref:Uncharacterized protein n=1 Tax=Calycina marina TaxID=1763456 RepID=A0A9P7Z4I9_9HELO|nr:hypothetical protein BJ878DRAFT_501517 [Calycina marina]
MGSDETFSDINDVVQTMNKIWVPMECLTDHIRYRNQELQRFRISLLTHAELTFGNEGLGELKYEVTATSVTVGGASIPLVINYIAHQLTNRPRKEGSIVRGGQHVSLSASS